MVLGAFSEFLQNRKIFTSTKFLRVFIGGPGKFMGDHRQIMGIMGRSWAASRVFQKLCPTPIMAPRWADLVQIQSKNLDHGLSVNLDPGSLILDTFFRIQDCAEAVR